MKKTTLLFFLSLLCVIGTSWSQDADALATQNMNAPANVSQSFYEAEAVAIPAEFNQGNVSSTRAPMAVYETTHGVGGSALPFFNVGATTYIGSALTMTGTNRNLTSVSVDLFNFNSNFTPYTLTMRIYTDCPSDGTPNACGTGPGVLLAEETAAIVPPPGRYTATVNFPGTDLSNVNDNITVMFNADNIDVGWIVGESVVTGSNPAPLSSLCGATFNGCAFNINNNIYGMTVTAESGPIINCPMDIMVNTDPGVCTGVANFADAIAIDPDGGPVTVVQTMGPPSGSDFPLGDTIVEFTATDDEGFSTSCQFTVTVIDNQPPMVTCPADIVVDNDPGVCGAVVTYPDPIVVDNCFMGGGGTTTGLVEFTNPTGSFSGNARGYTFVAPVDFKMTALRVPTNASSGQQSIQVMRFAAPVTTFPTTSSYSELLFHTGLDANDGYIPVDIDFFAGDIIGILGVRGTNNTNSYTNVTTEISIDGNTAPITRFGTQNPITTGPAPQGTFWVEPTVPNRSEVNFEYEVGSAGMPVTYSVITGFPSGGTFPVGTTLTTLEYTDPGGNAVQCTFNVTVNDIEAPTVSCIGAPGPTVGSTGDMTVVPIPDDDPAGVSTTITVADTGSVLDMNVDLDIEHTWVGDLIVTLESPMGTSVTLIDQMGVPASTFGCSNNDLLVTLDDEAGAPIEDECTGSPITGSFIPNEALSAFDGEEVNGDWILTISDNAGGDTGMLNAWTLNYDYDSPGIPLDIVLDANGMASIAASALATGWDDNCGPGGVTITGGIDSPQPFTLPTTLAGGNGNFGNMFDINALNNVTIQSFDIHGDTGATFDVEVYAKSGTWVGSEDNPGAWTLIGTAPGIVSNGDGVATPLNLTLGYTIPSGETHAFYVTPTDLSTGGFNYTNGTGVGNVFAADANIEFLEGAGKNYPFTGTTFQPRVFNGNIIYEANGAGAGGMIVDFTCDDLGLTNVTITATDAAGNEATCTAVVNVIDNTSPVLVCQDVTIELDENGMASIDPMDLLASSPTTYDVVTISSDNGSNAVGLTDLTVTVANAETVSFDWDYTTMDGPDWDSFGYLLNGVYTELTDPNGANNQSGNSGMINLAPGDIFGFRSRSEDGIGGPATTTVSNFVPGFSGQFDPSNWVLTLDNSDGDAFFVEIPGGPLSFDACGITTMAVDITDVTCADIAASPLTATVFATDASGNLASCQSMITVVDLLGPEVTCPADQTIDPGPGNLFYEVPDYWADGDATATDNCTDPLTIFSQDPAPGTLLGDGIYTVTICSTDEYGNQGCCTFELTIESILGNSDNNLNTAISMYPNPASDQVILANGSNLLLDNAMIYDMNGKLINTIDLQNMGSEMSIDVSALASGVYMVQITSEGATAVKRLIKE